MTSFTLALLFVAVAVQCVTADTKYCDDPDEPNYGGFYHESKHYPVGYRINYYCKRGYELKGSRWAVCLYKNYRTYWSHPAPKCIRIVKCPRLYDPRYGDVKVSGYKPGDKAVYSCNRGFELKGNKVRYCKQNGQWTGSRPKCVPHYGG